MKKVMRKSLLALGVSAAGLVSMSAQADIPIAIAGPVTGPVAQYGDMQTIGAKMAIEQINKAGGVNGEMLKGVIYDDVCEPKQAVAVANQIVNDGIQFVIGHLCSSSTQPASDIYYEEGILMISPASTNPAITEAGYDTIFRTIGRDDAQGPVAGTFIAEQIKPERMAIIHDKQQYGQGVATAVKETVEEAGINVVVFEGITAGQQNYSSLISKLKLNNVDFVYYGGYHPELGLILRQSAELGLDAQFMGPEGVGNPDISKIAGEASEGLLVTLPKAFETDPANADLVAAFEAKDQDPSGPFVMPAYTAVQVIAEGMEATDSTDPFEVAEYLHENTFDTPIGKVDFDEKGDLEEFEFVVYRWHADGTKTPVNTDKAQTGSEETATE
ncbi:branched-chain amino acid transport system substrate-binding protein [Modicisalibacter muralis]|uniref:Branched-chain amino acid transport system substrate-binding protein n=1 Tax=Modicisalibacter muralis TaxID=119000 RepID=A0A1G9GB50_9GAMM|nr:branched-chain amino acid ABC transporter substrate-binding protein [Halomonas muralis]SDK97928.1 branched-chain amino acid transport system substrate-binding protein [Halomonas muralis]